MAEPRIQVTIRMSVAGVAAVDQIAKDEGRSHSDVIRRLLSEALAARAKKGNR